MAYIGREPQIGNYQVCDAISVVNAQAAYTMQVGSVNVIPESVNHMIVSLNGVIQKPGSSYTISSSTITFSSNLATGDSIDFIYLLGNVLDLGTPSDDTVTAAKIVDNAINSEHYTDASIDLAHLSADSVDGSKIVDNAINSEHYTDGSIDTAHIGADQITNAKIADDAINSEHYTDGSIDTAHIADDQITAAKINNDIISGTTALAAIPATTDEFLISDAGTLKRIDAQFFQNTPAFEARLASDQNLSDAANGKLAFATETFDSDGKYDNSTNYRFTPTVAGKYFIYLQAGLKSDDNTQHIEGYAKIYFNGTNVRQGYFNFSANNINQANYTVSTILDFDADDYVEAYVYINVTTGTPVCKANASTFGGFKLIGV